MPMQSGQKNEAGKGKKLRPDTFPTSCNPPENL
jgi:hypothetical protein